MRTIARAMVMASLLTLPSATAALADGWADSTVYRNLGWTNATADYKQRRVERSEDTARPARKAGRTAAAREADDEDRPQRRTRAARVNRNAVDRGSVANSGGGTTGIASYYWQPQRVASGGWFNPNAMTAAHKTLPFGTRVRVTHLSNGRSVDVTINDRGPYIAGRIIDLSRAAAQAINMTGQGIARIRMTVIGRR